jgi:phage tail sheath gpL-like
MAIPMAQIPANLLVPGQYQEIDNSLAGSVGDIKKALIVGYKLAGAPAEAGKPVQVLGDIKAAELCGYGSDAAIMAKAFLEINKTEECWILPLAESEAGVKWSVPFTVAATTAGAGSVEIKINGKTLAAAVTAGDNAEAVSAAIVAKINSDANLPVEASVSDAVVTLTSLVKGYLSDYNTADMVSKAPGVTVNKGTVTHGSGGDYAINIGELFPAIGGIRFNYIVSEFDAAAHIKNLADELESRYSAIRQIGGRAFVALAGGVGSATESGTMLAKAEAVNSPHVVLVPRGNNPGLPCEWAARFCAAACHILADDPAANTFDTKVPGLAADAEFGFDTRQKMLESGIATWRLDTVGNVLIERLVTSYTENTDGGRDTSYLDIQVTETVDAVRTYINADAKKRFAKWKLAGTDENFGSGAKVMTTGVWRSFLAELYSEVFIKDKQWCQDFDAYIKSIIVEIKLGSKTRLEYQHRPNLMGQFYIGAGLLQFK